eukprot:2669928-Pleurochrysis_carterae.AAC.5
MQRVADSSHLQATWLRVAARASLGRVFKTCVSVHSSGAEQYCKSALIYVVVSQGRAVVELYVHLLPLGDRTHFDPDGKGGLNKSLEQLQVRCRALQPGETALISRASATILRLKRHAVGACLSARSRPSCIRRGVRATHWAVACLLKRERLCLFTCEKLASQKPAAG